MASMYAEASLALKELNWKAERGLDEMCKWEELVFCRVLSMCQDAYIINYLS